MKFKIISLSILLSFSALAQEAEEPVVVNKVCEFKIECHKNTSDYSLEYKVLGEGCAENAAGEFILVSENRRTPLQIKGLPLKKFDDKGNASKLCEIDGEKYPAVDLGDDRIALFVRIDNRPSLDRLGGIIIDVKKRKVIKLEENLGEIKNQNFAMLKSGRGFKTRLVKESLKEVSCDCDAAVIDAWKEITAYSSIFKAKWIK
ncbi:MAG: hypothetical protein H7328_00430 [Bdellovibrio sp.]|nr:hypothetical protein [Bdellovibrio sp.]